MDCHMHKLLILIALAALLPACSGTADGFIKDEVLDLNNLPETPPLIPTDDDEEMMNPASSASSYIQRSASSRKAFRVAPRSRIPAR